MTVEELGQAKVYRFDPEIDTEPRYEIYQVPYKGRTIMDVLRHIYENYDPTLSFRYGCSGRGYIRCGACTALVNGKPVLTCKKAAEKEMVIEPHPKFDLLKDLIVDFSQLRKARNKAVPQPTIKITIDPAKCVGCNDCALICPVSVYKIQKNNGKPVAVPLDINSCCGLSCNQCVIFCSRGAISLQA